MKLTEARCTNCGAAIQVNPAEDAAICRYCGTPFVVEKAINSYSINGSINGNVVNINGNVISKNYDFKICAGELVAYRGIETAVVVPSNVIIIGPGVFKGMSALTSVEIPDSVTEIGFEAFSACTGLKSVRIPDSVTIIGGKAFWCCKGLTSVSLPCGLSQIADGTFHECTGLKNICIPEGVTRIGDGAFCGCTELVDVLLPESVETIEWQSFAFCKFSLDYSFELEKRFGHEVRTSSTDEVRARWCSEGRCFYCGGKVKGGSFTQARCTKCGRRGSRNGLTFRD